ncbi:MAG: hypothetical protein JXB36_09530 [Gammaproteobacteria bacterium]|nr:hypothetical protein [Gammaproteobacteria bacterium]
MKTIAAAALTAALMLSTAGAQAPAEGTPMRLRGTIEKLEADTLTVLTESDGAVDAQLAPNVGTNGLERRTAADIPDGGFIGTTAAMDEDGRWRALEVHIFPEEMRGAGEGHYPWDFPETTMTNATVTGAATVGDGRRLSLTHAGGEVEVDVVPETDIVMLTFGDRSLLVPGAAVFVLGTLQTDGRFDAVAVVAETDGVKPPM